ncbi:MAG TPA: hypothetical protein VMU61_05615 [Candidatus Aquilonibacter sp.]|nr:hypothetical protein [Candidatus Aquilonibacter sp.]
MVSVTADPLQPPDLRDAPQETVQPEATVFRQKDVWSPEAFAREQIRGLVRQIFFSSRIPPVQQVVFSAAEPQVEVAGICEKVGWALAQETSASVALVGFEDHAPAVRVQNDRRISPMKARSTHIASNLWRVWGVGSLEEEDEFRSTRYWLSGLSELRAEFEYAVIQGPPVSISSEAALLGQLADGIVLVLGAHTTRRVTARRVKEMLEAAEVTILGSVLSERTFPIPTGIYRRL